MFQVIRVEKCVVVNRWRSVLFPNVAARVPVRIEGWSWYQAGWEILPCGKTVRFVFWCTQRVSWQAGMRRYRCSGWKVRALWRISVKSYCFFWFVFLFNQLRRS